MGAPQSKAYRRLSYSEKGHNPAQHESFRHRNFEFRDLVIVAFGTVAGTLASLLLFSFLYSWLWPAHFVPNLPFNTVKIWNQHDQYISSPDWVQNWNALLPHDVGFIEVLNPSRYGLTGGFPLNNTIVVDRNGHRLKDQPSGSSEAYCLSVMHQLHCLVILKEQYENANKGEEVDPDSMAAKHTGHCFDYLRQAVMCSADMSLEKARIDEQGMIELAVDGWGVEHKCRSWDAVETFAEKHGVTTGRGGYKLEGYKDISVESG